MTAFTHQTRNGRRKRGKPRLRRSLGIETPEQLLAHRELAYLRNPTRLRAWKLDQVTPNKQDRSTDPAAT